MLDLSANREKLFSLTQTLVRFRFHLATVLSNLVTEQAEQEGSDEDRLRSDVECALVDHFDPMLQSLLSTAGDPRARILENALDLARIRHRLQSVSDNLPRSPREEAMLEGEIPSDEPTEMRTTINAVIVDQLDFALENLLHAAGYKPPAIRGGEDAG